MSILQNFWLCCPEWAKLAIQYWRLGAERFRRLGTCTAKLKRLLSKPRLYRSVSDCKSLLFPGKLSLFYIHAAYKTYGHRGLFDKNWYLHLSTMQPGYNGDLSLFVVVPSQKTKLVTQSFEGIDTIQVVEEEEEVIKSSSGSSLWKYFDFSGYNYRRYRSFTELKEAILFEVLLIWVSRRTMCFTHTTLRPAAWFAATV